MICLGKNSQGAELLIDYCAGTLDPVRASELAGHIGECADCRRLVEAQQSVWKKLDEWIPAEISPDFDARLYARIAREDAAPVWRQWWRRITHPADPRSKWKPLVPLAAAAAALSLALMIVGPDVDTATPAAEEALKAKIEQRIDVDQVEQALDDLDLLIPVGAAPSNPL